MRKTWTVDETDLLKQNYNKLDNEALYELFPTKSPLAISKKARSLGIYKSKELEYINRSNARKREKGSNWRGGVSYTTKGYKLVKMPEHHRADSKGYVLEHVLIFERETGIIVPDNCCIHHINGDKSDNRIENLCLMLTSAHTVYHNLGRKLSEDTKKKISVKAKSRRKK
jgi:hypothetical protein